MAQAQMRGLRVYGLKMKTGLFWIIRIYLNSYGCVLFNATKTTTSTSHAWKMILLYNLDQNQIDVQAFADAIHDAGASLPNCWGFIDGTLRATFHALLALSFDGLRAMTD
ncbi:hypothetical protein P5673_026974 [Acropora cervicornis]|uniref:Uncharacterized protein n=1 Tax=Acropora cervicornis TaxID=6130 RepID=A0AAD9PZE9_ACRCE|nr:hypothetical protein P5673_026974 [Acropora cervicornis]